TLGDLSYAQLADAIAPNLTSLLDRIADGAFSERPVTDELIRRFHHEIIGSLLPEIAGAWRKERVQIGHHVPPDWYRVPTLMRDYADNVQERLGRADTLELQIELLAYPEGEFLHVHPFADFNGRAVRALLSELLRRLDFPPVEVAATRETAQFSEYTAALAHYDNGRITPLIVFWERRLESGLQ
ncbi:MAG: Fic family protein, partial [Salinibacterium sp.]|nr:Fic family protein [Salinibacterium sp.]